MLREELEDRFGEVPEPLRNLIALQQARIKLGRAGARAVTFRGGPLAVTPIELDSVRAKPMREEIPEALYESGQVPAVGARAARTPAARFRGVVRGRRRAARGHASAGWAGPDGSLTKRGYHVATDVHQLSRYLDRGLVTTRHSHLLGARRLFCARRPRRLRCGGSACPATPSPASPASRSQRDTFNHWMTSPRSPGRPDQPGGPETPRCPTRRTSRSASPEAQDGASRPRASPSRPTPSSRRSASRSTTSSATRSCGFLIRATGTSEANGQASRSPTSRRPEGVRHSQEAEFPEGATTRRSSRPGQTQRGRPLPAAHPRAARTKITQRSPRARTRSPTPRSRPTTTRTSRVRAARARDLRIVLTKTQAEASRPRSALESGQSWKTVAKKYSIDRHVQEQRRHAAGVTKGQQDRRSTTRSSRAKKQARRARSRPSSATTSSRSRRSPRPPSRRWPGQGARSSRSLASRTSRRR